MVILDNKGMLTAGNNQYLQPDYLSPLTGSLDSKKSPLALLAQTCSQIGADSSKTNGTVDHKKDEEKKTKSPTTTEIRKSPAFKPYEIALKKDEEGDKLMPRLASSHTAHRPSSSNSSGTSSLKDEGRRSSEHATSSASATPIIRTGLEILAGHPKDVPLGTYRPGITSFLPPGYPGLETHPALRGAPPGIFPPSLLPGLSLASSYSSAAAALYSSAGLGASLPPSLLASPYLVYTRVKISGGAGETVVPVCRDPFCTGCQYSVQNNHLLQSGGTCPPSCAQCEQAKAALSALPGLNSIPSSSLVPVSSIIPTTSLFSPATTSSISAVSRPYVCNWIAGDAYCGKRFPTSDELLQHLRSHTSLATDPAALSFLSSPLHAHAALLSSAHSLSGLHRQASAYPSPSLSPLAAAAAAASASRYHPYAKPHSSLSPQSVLGPSISSLSPYSQLSAAAVASIYPPGYPYASLYPRHPL